MLPPVSPFQLFFGMEFIVFLLLILIVPLILFIFVAVWMYRDANSRGMSGGLWVVLLIVASLFGSFVGGLVVLIVYLLVREGHLTGGSPYRYGYPPPGYGYPPYPPPGYPATPPTAAGTPPSGRCPRCGAPVNPGARFCASCGSPI